MRASFKVNEFLPTQVNATFSSDGRALAVGDGDRDWTLWDVEAGRERAKLVGQYSAVAIAPDGQGLFAVSDADVIQIWDLSRGPETGQDGGGAGSAPRPTDGTGGKPKAR